MRLLRWVGPIDRTSSRWASEERETLYIGKNGLAYVVAREVVNVGL